MISSKCLFIFSLFSLNAMYVDKQVYTDSIGNSCSRDERDEIALAVKFAQRITFDAFTIKNIDKACILLRLIDERFFDFSKYLRLYRKATVADKATQKTNLQKAIEQCDVNTVYLAVDSVVGDTPGIIPCFTSVVYKCIGYMRKTGDDSVLRILLDQKKLKANAQIIPFNNNRYGFQDFDNGTFITGFVSSTMFASFAYIAQNEVPPRLPKNLNREIAIADLFKGYKANS